jgi:succinyl-diaminopimelate desuccinylase
VDQIQREPLAARAAPPSTADELALCERLISYDTSRPEGLREAAGFIKGWLEARGIAHREFDVNGLPAIVAAVGEGPMTVIWNSHMDVVPGKREQFSPWRVDGKLYGRGAYDMKGGLAAMMAGLADLAVARDSIPGVKAKLLIVPDEEAEEEPAQGKASEFLAREGHVGEFAICGEPTDLEIGVQAKGVLILQLVVTGRSAHGSTPWLGENAVLRAVELYHRIFELPFASERSELFHRPSINLGRIAGGDVVNRVPDSCRMDVDIRYLPNQNPDEVLRQVRSLGAEVVPLYELPAATLDPGNRYVQVLRRAATLRRGAEAQTVGRDGASDAVFYLARGIPSVEFGPLGAGHHGPDEHVDVDSLRVYRAILVQFMRELARVA